MPIFLGKVTCQNGYISRFLTNIAEIMILRSFLIFTYLKMAVLTQNSNNNSNFIKFLDSFNLKIIILRFKISNRLIIDKMKLELHKENIETFSKLFLRKNCVNNYKELNLFLKNQIEALQSVKIENFDTFFQTSFLLFFEMVENFYDSIYKRFFKESKKLKEELMSLHMMFVEAKECNFHEMTVLEFQNVKNKIDCLITNFIALNQEVKQLFIELRNIPTEDYDFVKIVETETIESSGEHFSSAVIPEHQTLYIVNQQKIRNSESTIQIIESLTETEHQKVAPVQEKTLNISEGQIQVDDQENNRKLTGKLVTAYIYILMVLFIATIFVICLIRRTSFNFYSVFRTFL
ncbi:hypothetical protein M153_19900012193 [Pseudoloma neurophilia]|uniref:Uncharacterized protein n=1 Tax=Pseudoloma neurophilia TaxID=146866 RepID=A0A0R0M6Q5_9MICR|nr:hypothetical protein M153_19900012193 [Pseudoloma neurophilia]